MSSGGSSAAGLARIAVAALCVGAAVLIVLILGSPSDDLSGKSIGAAVLFAPFSLCALAGLLLVERQPQLAVFGMATIGLAVATYFVVLDAFWSGGGFTGRNVSVETLAIGTIAAGQASMLLSFKHDEDSPMVNGALFGSIAALALVAALAVVEISDSGSDLGPKPFGVLSVLYLLGVLLAPLLRRTESLET
jgi:hypothetical protein